MQAGNIRSRLQERLKVKTNAQEIYRNRAFEIIDSGSLSNFIELMDTTKDEKVFDYAVENTPATSTSFWSILILCIPGKLIKKSIEKLDKNYKIILSAIYNKNIFDEDIDHIITLAKSQNGGLDYLFSSTKFSKLSIRLAQKLAKVSRIKDIHTINEIPELVPFRIFCINQHFSGAYKDLHWQSYIERVHFDFSLWMNTKPNPTEILTLLTTIFSCAKSMNITLKKVPNIDSMELK